MQLKVTVSRKDVLFDMFFKSDFYLALLFHMTVFTLWKKKIGLILICLSSTTPYITTIVKISNRSIQDLFNCPHLSFIDHSQASKGNDLDFSYVGLGIMA